ncbi:hypothetical protein HBI31_025260 [Parastagonospora nodorum]|nr:hypothetical protein HBI31_025260 [Parastagonospora nodorum]
MHRACRLPLLDELVCIAGNIVKAAGLLRSSNSSTALVFTAYSFKKADTCTSEHLSHGIARLVKHFSCSSLSISRVLRNSSCCKSPSNQRLEPCNHRSSKLQPSDPCETDKTVLI